MGTCSSSQYASKDGSFGWKSTVNIIHLDGRLQQLKEPMKAWHVLSQNPNCFLCCSESMVVGSPMPPLSPSAELQLDHIYFLVPLSKYRISLSLQDLGALAIKANAALSQSNSVLNSNSVSQTNCQTQPILPSLSLGYSH